MKWNADEAFVPMTQPEWFSKSIVDKWNTLMPGKECIHPLEMFVADNFRSRDISARRPE